MPGVTPALGKVFAEAAAVCLEHNGHSPGVLLEVDSHFTTSFRVVWSKVADQQRSGKTALLIFKRKAALRFLAS